MAHATCVTTRFARHDSNRMRIRQVRRAQTGLHNMGSIRSHGFQFVVANLPVISLAIQATGLLNDAII